MTLLSSKDCPPGGKPFDGEIIFGIVEFGASLLRDGCLARVRIGIPGYIGYPIDVVGGDIEGGIVESLTIPALEFVPVELRARHTLPRLWGLFSTYAAHGRESGDGSCTGHLLRTDRNACELS